MSDVTVYSAIKTTVRKANDEVNYTDLLKTAITVAVPAISALGYKLLFNYLDRDDAEDDD